MNTSLEDGELIAANVEEEDADGEGANKPDMEKVIEDKIEASMSKVQGFFEQRFKDMSKILDLEKQLAENKRNLEELKAKGKKSMSGDLKLGDDAQSELTIYQNAVQRRREGSSSSEEDGGIISSDEQFESFDSVEQMEQQGKQKSPQCERMIVLSKVDRQEASTSGCKVTDHPREEPRPTTKDLADARANKIIKSVEALIARAYEVSGKQTKLTTDDVAKGLAQLREGCEINPGYHCVDDDYLLVASHLDELTCSKIINHEYIDFAKLLRRDRAGGMRSLYIKGWL